MQRWIWALGPVALGMLLGVTTPARADRIPSKKVAIIPQHGVRVDQTVPYVTNGRTTLGVYQGVAPRVYSSPIVEEERNPGGRRVYNLQFWGSVMSYGDRNNGAVPRSSWPPVPR